MKKLLALLLVLVMCLGVFASCGTPEPAGATLEEAKDYLYNSMKDKNDKATPSDYTVVAKLIMNNTTFNVTWTTDNENIVVKEKNANFYTIDVPDANATEVTYTLTATIKDAAGETIQVSFTPKLPVIANEGVITDLKENVAYKIFFRQVNKGVTLYALNTTQDGGNKYIEATVDPKEAADFYVEIVGEGYKFYTMIDGVKNYVHAKLVDAGNGKMSKYIGFAPETNNEFVYDESVQTFCVTLEGGKYGVGTYSTFETISISDFTYFKTDNIEVEDGQFPIRFYESAYAETLAPTEAPTHEHVYVDGFCNCGEADPNATVTTSTVITAEILGLDAYADGTKALTDITFGFTELGTYGDGIQWRTKDGKSSSLWNTTATTKGITKIEITLAEGKTGYSNSDCLKVEFGNAADSLTYTTYMSTEKDVAKYIITPDANTYTFVKFTHNYDKTLYIERITIYYEGADTPSNPDTPTPEEPKDEFGVIANPVAGTAYKFGMVQTNAGKTVYLKGGMDGYYMATTENTDEAIDVYLEATEGGYYLYTMSGDTKTYINMVVSDDGAHVNGAYEATASTVYTIDATRQSIVADIDGTPYHFGTRNDKNFLTVGPCKTSYNGFDCQFYGIIDTDEPTEPDTPVEPEEPEVTTPTYTQITDINNLVTGTYVIIVNDKTLGYLDGSWVLAVTSVVDGNKVTEAGAVWTITVTDNGVKITDKNGVSIGPKTGNENGIQSKDYTWEIAQNGDGTFSFKGQGSDTTILALNKQEGKFRAYKTTTVSGNPTSYPSTFYIYLLDTAA